MSPTVFTTWRVLSALFLVMGIVGMVMVPNPFTEPTPKPSATSRSIPNTDVNPLGANFFLDREVELWKREQTLKMAQDAGAIDVLAAYGQVHETEAYALLRRVTHWTDQDVERERSSLSSGEVLPTHTLTRGFDELLERFEFGPPV